MCLFYFLFPSISSVYFLLSPFFSAWSLACHWHFCYLFLFLSSHLSSITYICIFCSLLMSSVFSSFSYHLLSPYFLLLVILLCVSLLLLFFCICFLRYTFSCYSFVCVSIYFFLMFWCWQDLFFYLIYVISLTYLYSFSSLYIIQIFALSFQYTQFFPA